MARIEEVQRHFGDQDIVILGDFNCKSADEWAIGVFAGAGFEDLNAGDADTHVEHGPLDRILVPAGNGGEQKEFEFSRQYVMAPADVDEFDDSLSDHFLILASYRVMADDD